MLALGQYPIITLAEARKKRDEAKTKLVEGNPAAYDGIYHYLESILH